MSKLKTLFEGIPLLQDVRSALALVVLAISLGLLLVFGVSLIRLIPTYSKLVVDLKLTQAALEQARQLQKENPPKLRSEIALTQALLEEAASVFPSDQQAMNQLDDVYRYASEAGVYVAKLEKLVNTPEEESETTYTTRRVFLEATGDLRQLTNFIRLLTQVALPTFNLDNLKIIPSVGQHVLTAAGLEWRLDRAERISRTCGCACRIGQRRWARSSAWTIPRGQADRNRDGDSPRTRGCDPQVCRRRRDHRSS